MGIRGATTWTATPPPTRSKAGSPAASPRAGSSGRPKSMSTARRSSSSASWPGVGRTRWPGAGGSSPSTRATGSPASARRSRRSRSAVPRAHACTDGRCRGRGGAGRAPLDAGGRSFWYGPAVFRSDDLGATWSHSSEGLTYGEDGPKMKTVWNITPVGDALYAGVDPAGLFRSDDRGETWQHVEGLTNHPTRPTWEGGFGGLCLHSIVPHPTDPRRMWVAISAVGTFATEDGGTAWEPRNSGVRADFLPDPYPVTGQCVHKLVMAPGLPDRLYQENHCGTYRSDDAGRTWRSIEAGLPSTFGFPMVTHPHDPDTAFTVPLNGDDRGRFMPDGRAAVWRAADAGGAGAGLRAGLPQQDAYL